MRKKPGIQRAPVRSREPRPGRVDQPAPALGDFRHDAKAGKARTGSAGLLPRWPDWAQGRARVSPRTGAGFVQAPATLDAPFLLEPSEQADAIFLPRFDHGVEETLATGGNCPAPQEGRSICCGERPYSRRRRISRKCEVGAGSSDLRRPIDQFGAHHRSQEPSAAGNRRPCCRRTAATMRRLPAPRRCNRCCRAPSPRRRAVRLSSRSPGPRSR